MCTIIPVSWGSGFKFHRWGVDWRSFFSASLSWWKTGETHRKHVRNKQKLSMCRTKKHIRKCTTIERYHAHRVLFTINIVVKPKLSSELNRESEKWKIQKDLNKTTKKTSKLSQEYVRENASGTRVWFFNYASDWLRRWLLQSLSKWNGYYPRTAKWNHARWCPLSSY